jgi:hypothetical protein
LLIQKYQGFRGSKAFVSAIFEFFKFTMRYEWSNIRGTVQKEVIVGYTRARVLIYWQIRKQVTPYLSTQIFIVDFVP